MTDTFVRSTLAEIETLLTDRAAALAAALDEAHADAARVTAEAHAAALDEQAAAAAAREQALRDVHEAAIAEARAAADGEVARLVAERAAELDSVRAEHDLAVSALRDDLAQLTASLAEARTLHAAEFDAAAAAHHDEANRLVTAHSEQLAEMRTAHDAALADLRAAHQADLRAASETGLRGVRDAWPAAPELAGPAASEPPVVAWNEDLVVVAPDLPEPVDDGEHAVHAMPGVVDQVAEGGALIEEPTAPPAPALTLVGADWFRDQDEAADEGRDGARPSSAVGPVVEAADLPLRLDLLEEDAAQPAVADAIVEDAAGSALLDVFGEDAVPPGLPEAIVEDATASAVMDGILEGAAHSAPLDAEADRPRPKSLERMRDALAQLDGAASLKDTLDRLADVLAEHSPRSMVFIVRGDWLRGWRFNGFGDHAPAADSVVLAIEHTGEFRPVIEEGARADVHPSRFGGAMHSLAFAHLDGDATGVAVPVRLTGKSVAVLYVDEGEPGGAATGGAAEAVEILARHASRCLEAITATRSAAAFGARANGPGSNPSTQAVRRDAGGEHQGAQAESAPGLAVVPSPPVPPPSPEVLAAAERFAALVVSEIKLYNDAAIQMGRKKRDLRTRLHAEIDRASGLFRERMGAVPGHEAIFERELVRVLAGGDAELLGRPRAEAV